MSYCINITADVVGSTQGLEEAQTGIDFAVAPYMVP